MHVVGTAGHVDHGKSALVKALTGMDPDRYAEEKRRGMTIDLGFAWMKLPSGTEIGIIDVPGHERFIRNMLAGAGGVSVCLFVVAANEGWSRQSAEHLSILDILGTAHGVMALTKADLVDESTLRAAGDEVRSRVAGTSLEGIPIVACSAVTGRGLDEVLAGLDAALIAAPPAADRNRPRLWIDRAFTMAGAGTVVTGTTAGGAFEQGMDVEIAPPRIAARVRTIQTHRRQVERAEPGTRTALNLAGVPHGEARRGHAVVSPGTWRLSRLADVEIRMVGGSDVPSEMTEKGSYLLYVGTAETPATIRFLGRTRLVPGERAQAQMHLRDELPLQPGDRFVIRDAGRVLTLAGGTVVDPLAPRASRNDQGRIALISKLARAHPREALLHLVDHYQELDEGEALFRSGAKPPDVPALRKLGAALVSTARIESLEKRASEIADDYHTSHPLERGIPRELFRAAVNLRSDQLDDFLPMTDVVVGDGGLIRATSHRVTLDPEQQSARGLILKRLDEAAFAPPVARDLGADPRLLKSLVDAGEIVKVADFFLTKERAEEVRRKVADHIEGHGAATVAEIRDLLATSRKYAVPLCEWLDETGTTIRKGDVRILGPRARTNLK